MNDTIRFFIPMHILAIFVSNRTKRGKAFALHEYHLHLASSLSPPWKITIGKERAPPFPGEFLPLCTIFYKIATQEIQRDIRRNCSGIRNLPLPGNMFLLMSIHPPFPHLLSGSTRRPHHPHVFTQPKPHWCQRLSHTLKLHTIQTSFVVLAVEDFNPAGSR